MLTRARHSKVIGAAVLALGGSTIAAALYFTRDGAAFSLGVYHTDRGHLLALPGGTTAAARAQYDGLGERILVQAYKPPADPIRAFGANGLWLFSRGPAEYTLIHDNWDGSTPLGYSLRILDCERLSPSGERILALIMDYGEQARSIRTDISASEQYRLFEMARESTRWAVIESVSQQQTVLADLTPIALDENAMPTPDQFPPSAAWLDDERVVFSHGHPSMPFGENEVLYVMHVANGHMEEAYREPAGSIIGMVLRIADQRVVCAVGAPDGVSLTRVYDFRTSPPVARTVSLDTYGYSIDDGLISPDEQFFATVESIPGSAGDGQLVIVKLDDGQRRELPGEMVRIQAWHPDGTRLLGDISGSVPADPPGKLAEIPLADILASFD